MFVSHYKVQPFHEIAFASCFEEAYVPAYKALGKNIFSIINNRVYQLKYQKEYFCIRSYPYKEQQIIESMDDVLVTNYNYELDNIVDLIIDFLEERKLVICKVINIESYVIETGRKTEGSTSIHYVLIYGYDKEENLFEILEHEKNVSTTYQSCKISFEEISEGYKNAINSDGSSLNLVTLENIVDARDKDNLVVNFQMYADKFMHNETIELKSLMALKLHLRELPNMDVKMITDCNEIDVLSEMIKYIKRENWLLNQICFQAEYFDVLIKNINLLRTYCIKYTYTLSSEYKEKISKYCELTSDVASRWFHDIFNFVNSSQGGRKIEL